MTSLASMADSMNKLDFERFKDFILKTSLVEFAAQARQPLLLGKAFYDGIVAGKSLRSQSGSTWRINARAMDAIVSRAGADLEDDTNTAKLSKLPAGVPLADEGGSEVSQAVYLVAKRPGSGYPENVIALGRAPDNDIVISSPALSKRHAQIGVFKESHFIVDVNSTNGTRVDSQNAAPGVKVQLQFDSTVSLGGVVFVFVNPIAVYRAISNG